MYYYPNAADADFSKIFVGGTGTFIMFAYWVICIVGSWKMYEKAGHAGWKSLIPFYRQYILFDIVYPDLEILTNVNSDCKHRNWYYLIHRPCKSI